MKEALIDTNILYYWSGSESIPNFPFSNLDGYLQNNKIFISSISFLEMFVHYQHKPNKILQCLNHIKNKHLEIIDIHGTILPVEEFMTAVTNGNSSDIKEWIDSHRKLKVDIESSFLRFFLNVLGYSLHAILREEYPFNSNARNILLDFAIIVLTEASKDEVYNCFYNKLMNGYRNDEDVEKIVKESFNENLYKYFKVMMSAYYITYDRKNDVENDKYVKKGLELLNNGQSILGLIKKDRLTQMVAQKIKNRYLSKLREHINITEQEALYIFERLNRFLRKSGKEAKKMEKNDISDMLILSFIKHNKLILTQDTAFFNDLKNIHKESYEEIKRLGLK